MNLVEVLQSVRAQTTATLDTIDSLIQWAERVNQVLSVMGAGSTPAPPQLNGHSPKPGVARASSLRSTRDKVLAAARDWATSAEIIQAAADGDTSEGSVHTMIGHMHKDGSLRRRGDKPYQYRVKLSAEPKAGRKRGATRARVLEAVPDWTAASDLFTRLREGGLTDGQIFAAVRNMIEDKQLRVRGEPRNREFKAWE